MDPQHYIYLSLNIFTISYPLYKSFDPRVNFHKRWAELLAAIVVVGAFFLVWDYYFTEWSIWSFNREYVIGAFFFSLPLEEWLFFLTVPFACVFIHEVLRYFIKRDVLAPAVDYITWTLIVGLAVLSIIYHDRTYTTVNFAIGSGFLLFHRLAFGKKYLGRFYLSYLVHLIPFLLVNGVLTYMPVVEYNNAENLGIRLGTIPIEDTIYSMTLLFMNLTIYEWLGDKKKVAGA